MDIVIGADHGGFDLKEACRTHLEGIASIEAVRDVGVFGPVSSNYPDIAHQVARAVAQARYGQGILICGTGIGMSLVANRYKGVRACLCHNLFTARLSRQHNDANILVMGGRVIGPGLALEMVDIFLTTPFDGGRHEQRINQIDGR
ncbi:MAG: ribose 5-phosphate isomerase B [Desulfobacteraceae bacterium]